MKHICNQAGGQYCAGCKHSKPHEPFDDCTDCRQATVCGETGLRCQCLPVYDEEPETVEEAAARICREAMEAEKC